MNVEKAVRGEGEQNALARGARLPVRSKASP